MIGAIVNIALWLFGVIFKPKVTTAADVQRDEAQNALGKIKQADAIRDNVSSRPAGGLRDDPANLFRD